QRRLDDGIEHVVLAVVPWRGQIAALIAEVVRGWDTRTVTERLELVLGSDLQYIRINGAIDMLVLPDTGIKSASEALDRLCAPEAQVSAHYVLDEDGTVWRLVAEER